MLQGMFARTLTLIFAGTFLVALAAPRLMADSDSTDTGDAGTTANAAPVATAAAPTPAPYGTTAEMMRDPDGHFRADVAINGQTIPMLIDSGASMVIIRESEAARMGIRPAPSDYTGRAMTANGETSYAPVRFASIRIGGVERIDIAGAVMPDDKLPVALLGQTYLGALGEMSIQGERMRIR